MQNEKKNKHMTLEERIEIQECLSKGMTFKAIVRRIGKNPTTVSREVKQHEVVHHGYNVELRKRVKYYKSITKGFVVVGVE